MVFGLFETPRSFEQWYHKFSGRGLFRTLNPAKQVAWLAKNHPEWFFDFMGGTSGPYTDFLNEVMAYAGVFARNLTDFSSSSNLLQRSYDSKVIESKRLKIIMLGTALSTYERAFAFANGLGDNAPLFVNCVWPAYVGEATFVTHLGKEGCRGFLDGLSIKNAMRLGIHLSKFLKQLHERDVLKFASRFDETTCLYLISPPQTPSGKEHELFRSYMGFKEDLGFRLEAFARGLNQQVVKVLFSKYSEGFGDFLAGLGDRVSLFARGMAGGAQSNNAGRGLGADIKNVIAFFEGHEFVIRELFGGLGDMRVIFAMGCLDEISKLDPRLAQQVIGLFERAPGFLEGLDAVSLRDWQKVKAQHGAMQGVEAGYAGISVSPLSAQSKCLYCSDDLHEDDAVLECDSCHVVLHNACAESHGNVCPTMGCQGRLYAVASRRSARPRQSLK